MFIDALLKVSSAQAMGAGAVSTNSIDLALLTPGRQVGTGEALGFGINVDVAATVAATDFEIISATDAALTAGILSHVKVTIPLATLVAGYQLFLPLPQGTPTPSQSAPGCRRIRCSPWRSATTRRTTSSSETAGSSVHAGC
jgi:hypothetical protein